MTHDMNAERTDTLPEGDESTARDQRIVRNTSRRVFLQAVGAGAVLGAFTIGHAEAAGIPTPWLHRDGNLIRDPSGNKVILRGVNIPDVSRLNADNYYSYTAAEYIDWATNGNAPLGPTIRTAGTLG
ncbi:twin-arginine translocation signal domain-containing protein [Halocatena marina]|uniref:twin-arginine translocation signal domain-containing protein n=1 Tax=Halocatena marina TaxID=2934937 RepID=UPI00360FDA3F